MSLELLLGTELSVAVAAGHDVFGISAPGRFVGRIEARGVTHVPIRSLCRSWDLGADLRAAAEMWRALRELELDVLHTHTPKSGVLGRLLGRASGIPVVVNTCHGLWATRDDPLAKRAAVYAVEGFAAQFSHAELYQNAEDRRTLRWAVRSRRAHVVGNGVDLGRFRPDDVARARLRSAWGVLPSEVLIGGVGRRVEEKGLLDLSEAAEGLPPQARVVWVGPEDEVRRERIPGAIRGVELLDSRDDMPAVYSALDVFVLPSHREGLSRSAMEAAACGRAMVLSDIRGCREIGTHGKHLLLVPPRDPGALRRALVALVERPELRERLGASAARRAAAAFDQRAVAEQSLRVYADLAAGPRRR